MGSKLSIASIRLVDRSNHEPWHFLHGFVDFLNERLGLQISLTQFKGDIHLSELEKILDVAGGGDHRRSGSLLDRQRRREIRLHH